MVMAHLGDIVRWRASYYGLRLHSSQRQLYNSLLANRCMSFQLYWLSTREAWTEAGLLMSTYEGVICYVCHLAVLTPTPHVSYIYPNTQHRPEGQYGDLRPYYPERVL